MADQPNQGATGGTTAEGAAEEAAASATGAGAEPGVNQGATGSRPLGESPLSVASEGEGDMFAERPEAFVGAAFAGGLALALILRKLRP